MNTTHVLTRQPRVSGGTRLTQPISSAASSAFRSFQASAHKVGLLAIGHRSLVPHISWHPRLVATPATPTISNDEAAQNLRNVINRSVEVLASARTAFPFELFPDDIVVDRTKITITKRTFFYVSEVMSIRIEDILNVKVTLGPFLGSLTLAVRVMSSEDHHTINNFWRKDAIHLKHIIQGYVIAHHNNIDVSQQNCTELVKTLAELGHDASR